MRSSKFSSPPRLAVWLVNRLDRYQTNHAIIDDLQEVFTRMYRERGFTVACLWYWVQCLDAVVKDILFNLRWRIIMLKNYLKIALRNLRRYKGYSLINISGLAIGMACCILIIMWVQDELSYDRFHENADNIYLVAGKYQGKDSHDSYMPDPLTQILKEEYHEIVNITRYKQLPGSCKLETAEKSVLCTGSYVDPSFFEIFSFPLIKGSRTTVFSNPHSIVLSEEIAQKIFSDEDPMGKIIGFSYFGAPTDLTVSGIIRTIPHNSHLQFDFLLPNDIGFWLKTWDNNCTQIYVFLHQNSSPKEFSTKIASILKKYQPKSNRSLYLYPMKNIHLHPLSGNGPTPYITIFSIIAFFILLIACINFMNISTARSASRFKEIGIKKVIGSSRIQLITQFLSESVLLSFFALFLAVLIVLVFLPSVNTILGKQLNMNLTGAEISGFIGIALLTGLFAGSYPAFFLSSFHPVGILKRHFQWMPIFKRKARDSTTTGSGGASLRKILLIIQFSLAIFFIICMIFIYEQLVFIRTKDLGYDKDHVVVLEMRGEIREKSLLLKNELLKNPDIQSISVSLLSLIQWESSNKDIEWTGKTSDQQILFGGNWVDYDYLETFKMELVQGRFFSKEFSTDPNDACVINEAAVKATGMENPVGKKIITSPGQTYEKAYTIIGVLKDFHSESLHREIRPFLIRFLTFPGTYMCIRIAPGAVSHSLNFMEGKVREIVPSDPFHYYFFDEALDRLYKSEQLTGKLIGYFTFLAISLSCLGLFGLASFTIERRTKEIVVRKILGASVSRIVFALSTEFAKEVLIANLLAWPVAYFVMNKWLQNFAYRINMGLWVFVVSATSAFFIALLTVSYQSIKSATANPADSLRYE